MKYNFHILWDYFMQYNSVLGFKKYGDEYKIMGLSSYGKPSYVGQMKELFPTTKKFI